jgi:hypothetical protein
MNHDSLISVGCSLMYGSDHDSTDGNRKPSEQAYTNTLAKHYGLKHHNFSFPGSSNQNISRQVFIARKFADENNLKPVFWLAWTKYTHLGLAHLISRNIAHGWPYIDVQNELVGHSQNKDIQKWSKEVYKSLDKFSRFTLSVNTIIQTNLMLEKEGITAINTFNSETWKTACSKGTYYIKDIHDNKESLLGDWLEKKKESISAEHLGHGVMAGISGKRFEDHDPYMSELWAYMKSFKWYEWGEDNLGFQLWTRENKLPLYTNVNESNIDNPSFHHPGEEAHQEASKRIINSNIMETL